MVTVDLHTLGPDMWRKEYFYQRLSYQGGGSALHLVTSVIHIIISVTCLFVDTPD